MRIAPMLPIVALGIAGCAMDTAEPGAEITTTTTVSDASTSTTREQDMDRVDQAIADLAARIAAPGTEIEVMAEESVTWPDGSLGCPQPGEMYTQALVEGGRIVLGHDERVFVYHYGDETDPFLCPNPDSKDGGYQFIPPPRGDVEK